MKVVVTGATGFIGSALVGKLVERGDDVIALVRDVSRAKARLPAGTRLVAAELETQGLWCDSLDGADGIVHLAGEPPAAKRWDARQKQKIRDSRVESMRTIIEVVAKLTERPKVLVTASGVDYYPHAIHTQDFDDDEVTEVDPPGDGFLARVSRDVEKEASAAEALGLRVVRMRTALVMGKGAVALAKLRRPFLLFAGGRIGSGRQWVSWIHLDDVVAAYATALVDVRYTGPINLVTDSIRNAEFAKALGHALHRPSWLPAPGFAVKAVAGELAEAVLEGRRVVPAKLRELGFVWKYPTLDGALAAAV